MRLVRALLGLLLLIVPVLVFAAPPAGAEIIFTGACTVNATATFSPGKVEISAGGTCHLTNSPLTAAPMTFFSRTFPTGPSSCAASIGTGGGNFSVSPNVNRDTMQEAVIAGGTATIV